MLTPKQRKTLEWSARYGHGNDFMSIAQRYIGDGDENTYQEMAEVAASEGNLPVIQAIGRYYTLDYDSVATMARTYGRYDTAEWVSGGLDTVVPQIDTPTTEDLEEDRSYQAEMWQNMGGYTMIKTDAPIEDGVDTSKRYKEEGTRRWIMDGGYAGEHDFDVTNTNQEWLDSP